MDYDGKLGEAIWAESLKPIVRRVRVVYVV